MASPASVEDLRHKMAQAADLEAQLQNLPKKSSEDRSSRIRMQLCEILSDVLLQDPYFSSRKDCAGRLWRGCFYGRINELRSRISREKRKKGPNVEKLTKSLKTFLQEAIVLYRWIVNKYEGKLLPQLPQNQMSQDSMTSIVSPESTAGVIPGLHKLLIHLGDLNRYAASYKDAEKCYIDASKLAPGKGNPYNQLAVVAQLKEQVGGAPLSCVALYWFSRAILAVNDPFETANANLASLFQNNRAWLKRHADEEPVVPPAPKGVSSKKALLEQARAKKSAESQRFLAGFVDVHYYFFQVANNKDLDEAMLIDKVKDVISKFSALVEATAFGDSLLCKMVTVTAFSIHRLKGRSECVEVAKALLLRLGTALAQRVEKTLQKLVPTTKQHLSVTMPSVRLIVPLVLMCDYLFTFRDEELYLEKSHHSGAFLRVSVSSFWSNIAAIANLLKSLGDVLHPDSVRYLTIKEYEALVGFLPFQPFLSNKGVAKSKKEEVYVSADVAARLLDLEASATQESAVSLSSGTEEENRLKLVRFLQAVERFVRRWEKEPSQKGLLIRNDDGMYVFSGEEVDELEEEASQENDVVVDFDIAAHTVKEVSAVNDKNAPAQIPLEEANFGDDDDDAGDVVMYKPSADGTGPALLVPGPMLMGGMEQSRPIDRSKTNVAASETVPTVGTDMQVTGVSLAAGDSWKLASADTNRSGVDTGSLLAAVAPRQEVLAEKPVVAQLPPPVIDPMDVVVEKEPTKSLTPPPGLGPPPGFAGANSASTGVSIAPPTTTTQAAPPGFPVQASSAQQNIHMQGFNLDSMSTSNPFASEYPQPSFASLGLFGSTYGQQPQQPSNSLEINRDPMEDSSLLDTSFLTNLWIDENQTNKPPLSKNPFLT